MKILVNSLSKYILKVRKSAMANDKLKSTFLQPTTKLKEKVRGKDSMLYYLFHSSMLPVNSKWTSSYFCFDISYPMYQHLCYNLLKVAQRLFFLMELCSDFLSLILCQVFLWYLLSYILNRATSKLSFCSPHLSLPSTKTLCAGY